MKLYVYSKIIKALIGKIPQWLEKKKKDGVSNTSIIQVCGYLLYPLYFSVGLDYFII